MKPSPHTSFGLFSRKNFLSAEECAKIRDEMSSSEGSPSFIMKTDESKLDENIRRTVTKSVSEGSRALMNEKLAAIKAELGAWFGVELSHPQNPQFLYYRTGDFFQLHTDNGTNDLYPREVKDRLVSAVVFLNDENNDPADGSYTGGSLIVYGVLKDPRFEGQGFRVSGKEGTLIAFSSDMFHEVTPVTRGARFTVVSWFI